MGSVTVTDLGDGVHRITHPLPFALDHVHAYAIEDRDGWTIVDSGPQQGADERWREALAQLGDPVVRRVVITHHHPDHLGGADTLTELTGAELLQGRIDREVTERVYGVGLPQPDELLEEGDRVSAGSRALTVLHLPGHADGHIVLYDPRGGRLFGGDVILNRITPNVSWWPGNQPDPLALFLHSLARIQELRPTLVYPGHYDLIEDAHARAGEIREHHRVRLDDTERSLRDGAATPKEVLVALWGSGLTPHEQSFAYGEAVSHLVRLERLGRATEVTPGEWRAA